MRLIDADAFNNHVALYMAENAYLNDTALDVLKKISKWLEEEPALDYAPVRHGEWIEDELEYPEEVIFRYKCSECGRTELVKEPYCHCGARMDGGESDA